MLGGDVEVVGGIEDADVIKSVTKRIEGDGEFIVGGSRMRVYKVPCHTRGHVVYHILQTENGVDGDIKEKEKM
jgi:glyoxylase-like metal-dependent hydrolase (beta-lactamase superfamily II)